MKHCKYCQAELAENVTVCPACGEVQQDAAPAEEEAVQPKTKATPGKIVAAVIAVVLVVALLASVIVMGLGSKKDAGSAEAAQPTDLLAVEATIPADGNPDDVTCKGTYTADDATVIAAGDTVVATMGDAQLTVSQLNVYYWLEVNSFLNMLYNYGMDATYYGLDYSLGLDYQTCLIADGVTWQQFFLDSALGTWQNYQGMTMDAREAGYQLEADYQSELDNLEANLTQTAIGYGMADAAELLAANVGNGADMEDYRFFLENNYVGGGYLNSLVEQYEPTEEEMEAYFTENEEAYNNNGLTRDMSNVDVRHILVYPEGADSSTIRTETFPEEAWAVAEQKAQEILDVYLAGDMTEESFAALANEHSEDGGSNTNGGLYTEVTQGKMVPAFDAWCFDDARQAADVEIVKTEYGYHVMYFVSRELMWPTYARQDMITEYQQKLVNETVTRHPIEIDYSAIVLGYLDLMG